MRRGPGLLVWAQAVVCAALFLSRRVHAKPFIRLRKLLPGLVNGFRGIIWYQNLPWNLEAVEIGKFFATDYTDNSRRRIINRSLQSEHRSEISGKKWGQKNERNYKPRSAGNTKVGGGKNRNFLPRKTEEAQGDTSFTNSEVGRMGITGWMGAISAVPCGTWEGFCNWFPRLKPWAIFGCLFETFPKVFLDVFALTKPH